MNQPEPSLAEILQEVRRIEVQANRLVSGVMAGGYASVFHGSGLEFDEIREYVPGDDPRNVDWNVTARAGRPFVKEYVEERELTLLFVLDLSASMGRGGFGCWSPRQMAARVTACLALSALENDDKVGLIAFSGKVDRFVPPRKGVRHALRIVRDCLALEPSSDTTAMAAAVEYAARAVRRRSILFLLSDFLDPSAWSSEFEKSLGLCARRHDVVAARLLSPELEPPDGAGMMRVTDPETGRTRTVDWGSRKAREAYVANVAGWRRRTAELFRRAKVDLMDVPIPRERDRDAIARPILDLFRMRERREMKR